MGSEKDENIWLHDKAPRIMLHRRLLVNEEQHSLSHAQLSTVRKKKKSGTVTVVKEEKKNVTSL